MHNEDTTLIRDEDGNTFLDSKQQGEHIGNFYGRLYNKKLDKIFEFENYLLDLGNRLGNEHKKLTDEEKNVMEREFTIMELEESLRKSNMSSAAGWDGVSYLLIQKFWYLLGDLMTKGVNQCIREGEMSLNFRTGVIKLIPKKGDATKVEDWRPITLLSCSYKVFSGAVAARLEKVLPRLIGRGQKGFMKKRHIHSCTMNILDNISQAWTGGEETGILCVDFNKAFDSVEHYVIKEVLEFFGFGEYMKNTILTLLKGRQGVVLLTDGFSKKFDIKRGTPQGDRTSPYIFILCIEILLLHLKLVASERGGVQVRYTEMLRIQRDLEEGLIEAYADDLTVIFKWTSENLRRIIDVIGEFGGLTGLTINVKKTQLMIVGKDQEDEMFQEGREIHGIKIVGKVTVLGVIIDRKLQTLETNWEGVKNKMGNLARYWGQFNISLPARIMVAKTYIVSQAIYLMGVLKLSVERAEEFNKIVMDFVIKNGQPLARHKWFIPATRGGYNMVDFKIMDICIKASWVLKWCKNIEIKDYAGERVIDGNHRDMERIMRGDITERKFKGSGNILEAFLTYKELFYKTGSNIYGAMLFGNCGLGERGGTVEEEVFDRGRRMQLHILLNNVKVKDLLNEQGFVLDKEGMEEKTRLRLSMVEFFRLRTVMNRLKGLGRGNAGVVRKLKEILVGKNQGGGILRRMLMVKWKRDDVTNIGLIRSIDAQFISGMTDKMLGMTVGLWNEMVIPAGLREFIFKYINGRLYLNSSRARFDNGVRPECTFCLLRDENTRERETLTHLFWDCPDLLVIKTMIREKLYNGNDSVNKEEFWIGKYFENNKKRTVWTLIMMNIKWYIFRKSRMRKSVQIREIIWEIDQLKGILSNTKYQREMNMLWGE
jgi:hypothetical protein